MNERDPRPEAASSGDLHSRTILESITDGVFTLDEDWRFDYANPEAERILGRVSGSLLGKVIWDEYPGSLGTEFERAYRRVAAERRAESFLAWYADHGRWYDVRAFPSAKGLTVYFRDVTDAKEVEAALRASEERRRLALDSAELGAWNINPGPAVLTCDERFSIIFSGANTPLTYDQAVAALHDDDREAVVAAIAATLRADDPQPYSIDYRVVHPDGAVRWVYARGRANFDGEGPGRKVISFDGTVADITERKVAQEQLRVSNARFRTLFDSIDEGFCVIEVIFDASGRAVDYRFEEANPAFERHTGLQGAVGKTMRQFAPDMDEFWFETYGEVATTGRPTRFMNEAKALGRCFDVYAFPVGEPAERKVAVLFNDITARTRAEERLRQTAEELRQAAADLSQADRRKDEFLATLAHELRNPLAPMRNSLELMRRAAGDGAIVERAQRVMERQLVQMTRLVDDLLDVSRISSDKLALRRERIELAVVVQSAVETSRPVLEAAGQELVVALPEAPIVLDADLTRLAQVFMNLLNNAAKFSEPGGRITLSAQRAGSEVTVTVADTGVGIPAGELGRIFDMFSQVDASISRSQGGLGIGLTLVRRLVELHGGRVEARSAGSGAGSAFVVRLPIAGAPGAAADATAAGDAAALDAAIASSASGLRVLVVDDNRDAATSLAALLQLMDNDARAVHDGLAAVEMAAAWRPDVVLLDIGLPGLNGYEAARRIRAESWGHSMRLYAMTGWGQDSDRRKSQAAGFDEHLVKPVDPMALTRLLGTAAPDRR